MPFFKRIKRLLRLGSEDVRRLRRNRNPSVASDGGSWEIFDSGLGFDAHWVRSPADSHANREIVHVADCDRSSGPGINNSSDFINNSKGLDVNDFQENRHTTHGAHSTSGSCAATSHQSVTDVTYPDSSTDEFKDNGLQLILWVRPGTSNQPHEADDPTDTRLDAYCYIADYLDATWLADTFTLGIESQWEGKIKIDEEIIPSMEELRSYGELEKDMGTRACARLFRAPVIWERVGLGLWKKLRQDSLAEQTEFEDPLELARRLSSFMPLSIYGESDSARSSSIFSAINWHGSSWQQQQQHPSPQISPRSSAVTTIFLPPNHPAFTCGPDRFEDSGLVKRGSFCASCECCPGERHWFFGGDSKTDEKDAPRGRAKLRCDCCSTVHVFTENPWLMGSG